MTTEGNQGKGDLRAALVRHADLVLAAVVVAIVAMMIVPLPTPLLDLLLSVNIAAAVTLLLVSLYVGDALKIATFPTLLLLTTLFRLALEISATRLILLRADAGEVIHAFGNFVVAGNLVVGAVIFVILTVVQFIVISKGAERVAEVAARFTLDAMPGKQMSIDAELRAGPHRRARGARPPRGARARVAALRRHGRRHEVRQGRRHRRHHRARRQRRRRPRHRRAPARHGRGRRGARLHGAHDRRGPRRADPGAARLDGRRHHRDARRVRGRTATARATSAARSARQVLAQPKALAIAAGLLALLAVVPGLPALPFLVLAAALGAVAWRLLRAPRRAPTRRRRAARPPRRSAAAGEAPALARCSRRSPSRSRPSSRAELGSADPKGRAPS